MLDRLAQHHAADCEPVLQDDDSVADRHVDLDAGEFGGAMTDADYYDRINRGLT